MTLRGDTPLEMKPTAPASIAASVMWVELIADMTTNFAGRCASRSCGQQLDAADVGHVEVEQHQVGLALLDRRDRRGAVAALADDLEAADLEAHPDEVARVGVVVDDHDAQPGLGLGHDRLPARARPRRACRTSCGDPSVHHPLVECMLAGQDARTGEVGGVAGRA